MSEKEVKLNIEVKIPDEIQESLSKISSSIESIESREEPVQIDYSEKIDSILEKLDEEQKVTVTLNII
jgi:hypothetical protein